MAQTPPQPDEIIALDEEARHSRVRIATDKGDLVLEFYQDEAPTHVAAFLKLVKNGFYDGLKFHRVEPGFVDWFIEESARTNVDALARFVPMMVQIDLVPELGRIRCPVLIVVPGADPILSVDEYRLIERQIPGCEFVVYAGMPHNITDEVPDRCAGDLRRFLLRCAVPPRR